MMTPGYSDHPAALSQDVQPLLQDSEDSQKNGLSTASLRSLEDGEDSGSDSEELRPQRRPGFWARLRMSMQRRRNGGPRDEFRRVRLQNDEHGSPKIRRRKRYCLGVPVLIIFIFGLIHILNFSLGYIPLLWDDPAASSLDWTRPGQASSDIASHLLDITRDVTPIPCHSHNDYWRRVPLYDALRWGCTGVEADVWLFDEDLYVGHSTSALKKGRTFRSMYVDPLVKMLDHKNAQNRFTTSANVKNGVFETAPEQTLVLLVDFKNNGHDIFPYVSQQLQALREKGYLTYYNGASTIEGPITVVATGNAPFDLITANTTYRDIFFDAPLDRLYEDPDPSSPAPPPNDPTETIARDGQGTVGTTPTSTFDSTNSYYASVKFSKALGITWFTLTPHQLALIRGQVHGAHKHGLKARYWSAPKWPVGLRNKIWNILVEEGVDYLNGDDLQGMARLDWGLRRHWTLIG